MNSGRVPGHSRGLLWPAALGYGAFEPDSAGVPGTATGRGAGTVLRNAVAGVGAAVGHLA